jgi:hypothetical protein
MKKEVIKILHLEAKVGEKVFGFVDVRDHFGTISPLPTGLINGTEEGPTLLVTAGVHACEYAGIEGVIRFYRETGPRGLKGNVIVITCMNLPALRLRTPFLVPFDNKNLNRVFPGHPDGSPAEVIAHTVMKEFLPKANYVVDCHCGDIGEKLFPMTICNQTNDEEVSKKGRGLANAFGLDYSYCRNVTKGGDGNWITEANKAGVPAIVAEAGYDGLYEEGDIAIHLRGLKNVLKYLDMIPGKIERESDRTETTYIRSLFIVKTNSTGMFHPKVEIRTKISIGQVLAEIKDIKGDVIEEIKSPENGILLTIMTKRVVNCGDSVMNAFKMDQ